MLKQFITRIFFFSFVFLTWSYKRSQFSPYDAETVQINFAATEECFPLLFTIHCIVYICHFQCTILKVQQGIFCLYINYTKRVDRPTLAYSTYSHIKSIINAIKKKKRRKNNNNK